jgi:putative intracellular protease/amidase
VIMMRRRKETEINMAPLVVQIVSTLLARRRTELARHWKCGQRATESAPEPLDTAILVAGGQAPMFTFDTAETLQTRFVEFYERGKLSVALCHGVAILKGSRIFRARPPPSCS